MPAIVTAARAATTLAIVAAACAAEFGAPAPAHALSFTIGEPSGPVVEGSGKIVDVHRSVGAFSTLRIEGPLDVEARPGASPGVTVHADDNVEPLVESVVEGDVLTLRLRHGTRLHTHAPTRVEVQFTKLDATKQAGSGDLAVYDAKSASLHCAIAGGGDLALHHVQAGQLEVAVAGSGDVTADGQADEARFSVAGSGDVKASELAARKVAVHISGSGDARVQASDSLDARVSGSGDVAYRGHPHDVTRKVSGSGSVHAED
jgi:hypothetical protein